MRALVLALAMLPTLHGGQRQWYMPDALAHGAPVACVSGATRLVVHVPRGTTAADVWNRKLQASISVHANGAAEFDCGVGDAPPRIPSTTRYLIGRNGLGLLRGPNTRARLQRLYGRGVAHDCAVRWPAIGLRATFASCAPDAALTGAWATGSRWSTLDGVHVGDSVARMFWQDAGAKQVAGTWILGAGRSSRLYALVSLGTVQGFRFASR